MTKHILQYLLFLFFIFFIFILICGIYVSIKNNYKFQYQKFEIPKMINNYDEISNYKNFNYVKDVPDTLVPLFGFVSTYYPELKGYNIRFRYEKINTTMQANPVYDFFFRLKSYEILINSDMSFEGVKFFKIPLNAQIGVLAHEFSHILHFTQRNKCELFGLAVSYVYPKERKEYEKQIDKLTIMKGFGFQLKDWAQYAMFDSDATLEYKSFKRENYLNPMEIQYIILNISNNEK